MRHIAPFKEKPGPHNSLKYWRHYVPLWRVVRNYVIVSLTRISPSLRLKVFLLRLLGMTIGENVAIGLMVMFDVFEPQRISIGDNCILGYNATILAHEFRHDAYYVGDVNIGKGVLVGANCTVLAGVNIGDHAVVSAMSLVNKDVPGGQLYGGVPATDLRDMS